MKKKIFLSAATLLALGVLAGCGGGGGGGQSQTPSVTPPSVTPPSVTPPSVDPSADPGTIDLGEFVVWCDEKVNDSTARRIQAFMTAHPNYNMSYKIEDMSESTAASSMIEDPDSGADIYFFAQDQLSRLVSAGAIADLTESAAQQVAELNDAGSVLAATFNGTVYAYPTTSDNGYFMYYNSEALEGVDVTDMDAIVAAARAQGKTVSFNYKDAWYNAGFFFGYGCEPVEYETDDDGNFVDYVDHYNSPEGLLAAKAIQRYATQKDVFNPSSVASDFNVNAIAVVSGTWDATTAKTALGENFAATVLPKVRCEDGAELVQLSSFAGFKLVGTKNQGTADRARVVSELALWLTNEDSQRVRFEENSWGPSNKVLQADPEVASDPTLRAIWAQNALAKPQGQYPDGWWLLANAMGADLAEDIQPQQALDDYTTGLPGTLG